MHSQTFQSSSQLGGTHVDLPSQFAGLGGSTCPFAPLCGNKPESSTPTRQTTTEGSATHSSHRNDLNWADTWSDADLDLIKAEPGEPAGQAKCESLTLLAA